MRGGIGTKRSVLLSVRLSLSEYKFNINHDDIQCIDFHNNERPNDTSKVVLIKHSFEHNTILEMMSCVIQNTNSDIEYIKFYNGQPVAFRNPET